MNPHDCPDSTPVSIHGGILRVHFTTGWAFKLTTLMPHYVWYFDVDNEWRVVFKTRKDYRLLRPHFATITEKGDYFKLYSSSSCYEIRLEELTKAAGSSLGSKRRGRKHKMRLPLLYPMSEGDAG